MSTENSKSNKKKGTGKGVATTGIFAALAASSCCIPPVIAAVAGIGGISSSLSWMEPLRPWLIGLAVIAIGYAWYAHFKPATADDCGCAIDDKPKWYQTKGYLVGITVFAAVSMAFPYYSGIFFTNAAANKTIVVDEKDVARGSLSIEGMTCTGCERHVDQVLNGNAGVVEAGSSYKKEMATVKFDRSKTSIDKLARVLEKETGYKVTNKKVKGETP